MSRATGFGALVGLVVAVVGHRASHAGAIENPPPSEPEPLETSEPLDRFGSAMAFGDFDGDGVYDLAAGAYGESFGSVKWTGAVLIFRGTGDGGFESWRLLSRFDAGFFRRSGDHFGHALATGDYDGDGYDDLAIGAPGVDGILGSSEGRVHIAWGSFAGLGVVETISLGDAGTLPTGDDLFGFSLATGDFNGDEVADLAIGAIGVRKRDVGAAGQVFVMTGSEDGLQAWSSVHQETPHTAVVPGNTPSGESLGTHEAADWFGWSLGTGDLDEDGLDDLVVGAPGDKEGGPDAGAAYVFLARRAVGRYDDEGMLGMQRLDQGGPENEQWDHFGMTVAIGNFRTSNWYSNEIVVGAPGEDLESAVADDAGWVYTFQMFGPLVPLSSFGQSFLGDNGPGDRFGSAMLVTRGEDGRNFLLVSSPGDDRDGVGDAGEVLLFAAMPEGPVPAVEDPEYPEATWYFGRRAGQRHGRALAVDPAQETVLMSGEDVSGAGVINDYMNGPLLVEGLFQETAVYQAP